MVFYDSQDYICPMVTDYDSDGLVQKVYLVDPYYTCPYIKNGYTQIVFEENGADGKFVGPFGSYMEFYTIL